MVTLWPDAFTSMSITNRLDGADCVLLTAAWSVLIDTAASLPPPPPPHAAAVSASATTTPPSASRRLIVPSALESAHRTLGGAPSEGAPM